MTMNVATSVAQATASLNVKQTEADAARSRADELQVELKAMQDRVSELGRKAHEALSAANAADHLVYKAGNIVGYAVANEIASAADVTKQVSRETLIAVLEYAIKPSLPYDEDDYSYGECIVNNLETAQGSGGLAEDDEGLPNIRVSVVKRDGSFFYRPITKGQLKKAWAILEQYCPRRDNGRLNTPYVLTIDEDGYLHR